MIPGATELAAPAPVGCLGSRTVGWPWMALQGAFFRSRSHRQDPVREHGRSGGGERHRRAFQWGAAVTPRTFVQGAPGAAPGGRYCAHDARSSHRRLVGLRAAALPGVRCHPRGRPARSPSDHPVVGARAGRRASGGSWRCDHRAAPMILGLPHLVSAAVRLVDEDVVAEVDPRRKQGARGDRDDDRFPPIERRQDDGG